MVENDFFMNEDLFVNVKRISSDFKTLQDMSSPKIELDTMIENMVPVPQGP